MRPFYILFGKHTNLIDDVGKTVFLMFIIDVCKYQWAQRLSSVTNKTGGHLRTWISSHIPLEITPSIYRDNFTFFNGCCGQNKSDCTREINVQCIHFVH